jgi:hypothetical protein
VACLLPITKRCALATRYGVDIELLRDALLRTGAENGVLRQWGTQHHGMGRRRHGDRSRRWRTMSRGLPQVG